jgi:ribosome-associated toxin RatA of RatAB toxin-antitoxin module
MTEPKLTSTTATITVPVGGRDPQTMAQEAYAMMIDVQRYPDYMPSVNALEILEHGDHQITTRWDARIDGAPIQWVQRVWWTDANRKMHFEAIEGDFDVFQGQWSAGEADEQVRLQLRVEYRLGIPVIEEVLGPILKEKVTANSQAMLAAIAERLTGESSDP